MEENKTIPTEPPVWYKRWLSGIPYEVAFWNSYYGNRRRRKDLFRWSMYGKECVLDHFDFAAYAGALPHPIKILDVGCALSYMFGNKSGGKEIDVDYVDPLAPFYNRILTRYRIERPAITFGMIEELSAAYAPESTDFIHVRNALDHCANPVLGITECLTCLRTGGILYLNHFRDEALKEAYRGFHQFNITERDGNFIIWNNEKEVDVTRLLQNCAQVETTVTEEGRIVAVIKKLSPLPQEMTTKAEHRTAEMLMNTAVYFHSTRNSFRYQWAKLRANIGHRLMRLLPYRLLNFLKRSLSKKG